MNAQLWLATVEDISSTHDDCRTSCLGSDGGKRRSDLGDVAGRRVGEAVRLIHIKTARHILNRYYQKHGNARASVSFLQQATGLTRGSVASATEDLVAWGYFTRVMGSGKRPSEYHPNFSVLQSPDTTSVLPSQDDTKSSVLQPQDEIVLGSQDAKSGSVLQPQEQTHLLVSAS